MALDKDFAAAAEVMLGAVEAAPRWAAGWLLLGDYRVEAGDRSGAMLAYRQVEALDYDRVFGAALKLAADGGGTLPSGTDRGYVEALFDEYAPRFEAELIGDLGYAVPQLLGRLIAKTLGDCRLGRSLDLGCGTGLMGLQIRSLSDRLEGVDLSARMLAEAERKGIYDQLTQMELLEFLAADIGSIELATAADVLNYSRTAGPGAGRGACRACARRVVRLFPRAALTCRARCCSGGSCAMRTMPMKPWRHATRQDSILSRSSVTGFATSATCRSMGCWC